MNKQIEIAKTIIEQIKVAGLEVMWSWGARKFIALPAVSNTDGSYQLGGVTFMVSGRLFKGHVQICLMANDTYTVNFVKYYKKQANVKKSVSDVYWDNLSEVIDSTVETPQAA